ncbi:MAG: HNH endonuclease, partial [Halobacteria archaeon]|nr:HNH endonuclease [Halobacteria archaeon]
MSQDADYSPKYDDWSSDEYPPDWEERKRIVRNRHDHRCQNCGAKYLPENDVLLDVDHKIPKSKGGSHSLDNLWLLCRECHAKKHPGNEELAQRADSTPLLVSLLVLPVRIFELLFGDSDGVQSVEDISTDYERVGLTAEVDQLWEPNTDKMQQVGLLSDGDDKIKFVSWKNNEVKQVQ